MPKIKELRELCQGHKIEANNMSWNEKGTRKISIYFTWMFIKLGLSADHVTFLAMLMYISAGFLILPNNFYLGILAPILLVLYHIFDHSDGEVARYHKRSSHSGLFFDRFSGVIAEPFLFGSIALSIGLLYGFNFTIVLFILVTTLLPSLTRAVMGANYASIVDALVGSVATHGTDLERIVDESKAKSELNNVLVTAEGMGSSKSILKQLIWFIVTGGKPFLLLLAILIDYLILPNYSLFGAARVIYLIGFSMLYIVFIFSFTWSTIKQKKTDLVVYSILQKINE